MDTVIAALLVLTLALVGGLIIVEQSLTAQEAVLLSFEAAEGQAEERARTALTTLGAETQSSGAIVEFSVQNTGTTKLADYDMWDVIVQYKSVQGHNVAWLPNVMGEPAQDQWSVVSIYADALLSQPEVFEPSITNPGEAMTIRLRLHPPVSMNSTNLVTLVTDNGISATAVFTR